VLARQVGCLPLPSELARSVKSRETR